MCLGLQLELREVKKIIESMEKYVVVVSVEVVSFTDIHQGWDFDRTVLDERLLLLHSDSIPSSSLVLLHLSRTCSIDLFSFP